MYNRRNFLKKIAATGTTLSVLNGLPLRSLGRMENVLSNQTDRILVMIQLYGGNDGLNTIVPLDQYDQYHNLRPNLALPEKGKRQLLKLNANVGLHPDMSGFRDLYDRGELAVVQGVGYDNFNQSHFRSTNIWLSGSDSSEHLNSGWTGRYLDHEYSGYFGSNAARYPDPPGLEIGNSLSLAFHTAKGTPIATAVQDPSRFYEMVTKSGGNLDGQKFSNNTYGQLLQMMTNLELKADKQAERIRKVYESGRNTVSYPDQYPYFAPSRYLHNPLSEQLKTIAKLISGGSRTKVYLAKMGGFDTHKRQVEIGDPTFGAHACLLYHLSSAVKSFQDDLRKQGLSERVVTMTFSEFGRRAKAGYDGTDHGKAAPLFVIGKPVKAGIIGEDPDLFDLDNGNLKHEIDYRQVYTTILDDWLNASDQAINEVRLNSFVDRKLDLFSDLAPKPVKDFTAPVALVKPVYPNPTTDYIYFSIKKRSQSYTSIHLYNSRGETVGLPYNGPMQSGEHLIKASVDKYYAGIMYYKIQAEGHKITGSFIKK